MQTENTKTNDHFEVQSAGKDGELWKMMFSIWNEISDFEYPQIIQPVPVVLLPIEKRGSTIVRRAKFNWLLKKDVERLDTFDIKERTQIALEDEFAEDYKQIMVTAKTLVNAESDPELLAAAWITSFLVEMEANYDYPELSSIIKALKKEMMFFYKSRHIIFPWKKAKYTTTIIGTNVPPDFGKKELSICDNFFYSLLYIIIELIAEHTAETLKYYQIVAFEPDSSI